MNVQTILILLAVGVLSGGLSGLIGVGGGIIIVPALVFFMGMSQKAAQGSSLGILLLPVGIMAVWEYYKNGFVDTKVVLIVAAGFLLGGVLGSRLAMVLPSIIVKKIFALVLLLVAIKILFEKS